MQTPALPLRLQSTKVELVMLLLASLSCVVVLTAGIVKGSGGGQPGLDAETLLLSAIAAGAALAVLYLLLSTALRAKVQAQKVRTENHALRRDLSTAESIVKAEPQILVYWEQGQGLKVVMQSLRSVAGVPSKPSDLIRFGAWLDSKSALDLKAALEALFAEGRAFSLFVRTGAGGQLEADGRAAGGRAVLKLRDVAGYRRDLGYIIEQHRRLARDIRSTRALLNALPNPSWLCDEHGRLIWVSTAYVAAVEARNEDEVLSGQIELLESRQRKAIAHKLGANPTYTERLPLVIGGDRKTHDVIALRLEGATAGVAVDVAALETAQDERDRLIAMYDRTLDRVSTGVAIFNADQRLTFFNSAYARLWQLDADWLRAGPEDGVILDRVRDSGALPEVVNYRDWKRKLLETYISSTGFEDWWHLPDGRVIHVITEKRPDGGVTYLYGDETERLALESRYNGMISVRNETLNSLKEGVAVFGTDGRLRLFNAAFAAIWKLSRRRLAEMPHVDEFIRDASVLFDDTGVWHRIGNAVTSYWDQRETLEGQMRRPDGSVVEYAATPLPDGATLITFADVTDARHYERALVERNEALVAADRLKNQFIGHVSYELRTPLTNIIGFSDLLASPAFGDLTPKQREYLNDISSSSHTLLAIIDDILDLATIDAGAMELKLVPIDVRTMLKAAILGIRDRAVRARLTLDIAVSDDATTFLADEARVRQVLYNLLSNAVGFSPAGSVVSLECWRENGNMVFSIADQGAGIPKERQERIFERFESFTKGSNHRGPGLGLPIVRNLVELHGGTIALESDIGRGTRVTVRFPLNGLVENGRDRALSDDARMDPY